uniref:Transmembrane protein n=1 Tax=Magallana gigas TaxID=29159 RepID=A0A8W8I275_MAGGI|nr:uncharacterized protein LOC105330095 [Crassostrea gigas]
MVCLKWFFLIVCVICLPYSWALPNQRFLNQDKQNLHRQVEPLPIEIENEEELGPFEMEGVSISTTPRTPIIFDIEENGLDQKLLGLPGWEYLTVSLVVVVATVIGGSVAIVCKKCGGFFGKGSEKDSD